MRPFAAAIVAAVVGVSACGGAEENPATTRCTPDPKRRDPITIAPKWKAGDKRSLTITKSRDAKGSGTSTPASLTVLESRPKRSLLRLTMKTPDFGDSLNELPALLRDDLARLLGGMSVEYATDADGAIASIENLAEIRRRLERAFVTFAELGAATATDGEPLPRRALERLRSTVTSEAFVASSASQELGVLHYAYGAELRRGDEPQRFENELPNPFGGDPFPATETVRLLTPRDRAGCVALEIVTTPDEDQFRKQLGAGLEKLSGRRFPEAELDELRMRTVTRVQWDPGSGWIVRAAQRKEITGAGADRVDTTVIELTR